MEPFGTFTSFAASMSEANIDTDIIFPARFLLLTQKRGLGQYALFEKRFDADGKEIPEFVLNQAPFRSAKILIVGDNFGTGSSREQAPWVLADLGFRCLVSSSFGEIFFSNCIKNGLLPVVVSPSQLSRLHAQASAGAEFTVDLQGRQLLCRNGEIVAIALAEWQRAALINGWDEIALILNHDAVAIAAFESRQRLDMPWLYRNE